MIVLLEANLILLPSALAQGTSFGFRLSISFRLNCRPRLD